MRSFYLAPSKKNVNNSFIRMYCNVELRVMNFDLKLFQATIKETSRLDGDEDVLDGFRDEYSITLEYLDDEEEDTEIGFLKATGIRFGAANFANVSTYDMFDAITDQDAEYLPLIDKYGNIKRSIRAKAGENFENIDSVLLIHECAVNPKYRGFGLGLKMVSLAIEKFSDCTYLVACKPHPIVKLREDWLRENNPTQAHLFDYWSKLCFVPTSKNSAIYILNRDQFESFVLKRLKT